MTDNDVLDEHGMLTERDRQIIRLALRDPETARGMSQSSPLVIIV